MWLTNSYLAEPQVRFVGTRGQRRTHGDGSLRGRNGASPRSLNRMSSESLEKPPDWLNRSLYSPAPCGSLMLVIPCANGLIRVIEHTFRAGVPEPDARAVRSQHPFSRRVARGRAQWQHT